MYTGCGRSAVVKMIIHPHLLCLMQTIPIHLPLPFLRCHRKFVWLSSGKIRPHALDTLTSHVQNLKVGSDYLYKYYLACHLTRTVDWKVHKLGKVWVTFENSFTCTPTHVFLWLIPSHCPWALLTHPLIYLTLVAFKKAMSFLKTFLNSMPVDFTEGKSRFPPWGFKRIPTAGMAPRGSAQIPIFL